MFVSDQRMVLVRIGAARTRLAGLVRHDWLSGASQQAYRDGLSHLLWAGPGGSAPGLPQLVHVQYLDPVEDARSVITGMRWHASAVTGQVFPALDADIRLDPEASHATWLTLTGIYRPPIPPLAARLDQALLHKTATTTIRSLLAHISQALEDPGLPPG
jgi:hypothetical protein